jgi:hypothetical protein
MAGALIRLPSGSSVRVHRNGRGAPRADDVVDGARMFAGRTLAALLEGEVVVERGDGKARVALTRQELLSLDLRDFHVLRDVCERLGAVLPEETDAGECRNCDSPLVVEPRGASLEDLQERYEREPKVREERLAWASAGAGRPRGRGKSARARGLLLRTPTVEQARPLWAALAKPGPLLVTPALVRALGVRSIGAETRASLLADALARAPDRAWAAVERGFLSVAYAERSFHPFTCAECGALHEIDAPLSREFVADTEASRRSVAPEGSFPDAAEFERLVERLGAEVYAARGVQRIALRVDDGVPDIDTAGEPLLGSYEPREEVDAAGNSRTEFLVTVYFRSFKKMHEEDGPYDLEAELRETIDHEIEHHLYYLAGHDPMDATERAEARRELEDVYGRKTLRSQERREVLAELARGLRFVVPLLVAVALLLWLLDWLGYLA